MIHIFQAVAEQPEWLDKVLNLWSEAGGWVKALVALLGTIPIGAIALGIKGTLKNRKLNGNIMTTLNIVKDLPHIINSLFSGKRLWKVSGLGGSSVIMIFSGVEMILTWPGG